MKKGKEVFVAPNATLIGQVELGDESSVWFGAVLRGDGDKIVVGARSNIQDGAIVHVDPGVPVHIGEDVVVGHGAIVHGATVDDSSLIGMRATLLNRVKVGRGCIIGAHSLLTEGTEIPDYSLVMGTPGKVVKQLSPEQAEKIKENAARYVELGKRYLKGEFKAEPTRL
ncbi:gamma carbonic anhydrase family protein [Nafulsella turpanensis]|uniref:gamma carbonic anhydrase family protein n=1 Tax=Nafulsella turpanensis TaxID=1265690 RepID=UPI000349F941|nr:gamma carbonic anhydrase family protein [Nafulsella turpanensis]